MQFKEVDEYINKICEQVRFKKAHFKISTEIKNHILEQQEFFIKNGYNEKEALQKSIKEMGDAVLIGENFNNIYKPKINWNLIIFVSIVTLMFSVVKFMFGIYPDFIQNYLYKDIIITVLSIGIMILGYFLDYTLIVKHSRLIFIFTLISMFFLKGVYYINGRSILLNYIITYLPILFCGVVYNYRNRKYEGLIYSILFMLSPVIFVISNYAYMSTFIIYILCCSIILFIAVSKGFFNIKKIYPLIILIFTFIFLIAIDYIFNGSFYFVHRLNNIFSFDINGSGFIKNEIFELLKSFNFIGGINSLQSDSFIGGNFDYMIIDFIDKFGYIILLPIFIIFSIFFGYGFYIAKKQKSILGNIFCNSILIIFLMQIIIYTLNNFIPITYVLGIPFISYGFLYKFSSMFVIGLFLSIFKQEEVVVDDFNEKRTYTFKITI